MDSPSTAQLEPVRCVPSVDMAGSVSFLVVVSLSYVFEVPGSLFLENRIKHRHTHQIY